MNPPAPVTRIRDFFFTGDNLSRLRPNQIVEIRYLSATDAAQRFGTSAGSGGVIVVKTR